MCAQSHLSMLPLIGMLPYVVSRKTSGIQRATYYISTVVAYFIKQYSCILSLSVFILLIGIIRGIISTNLKHISFTVLLY